MKIFYFLLVFVIRLLFMAWTTPKTWSSEPLTSSDLNAYIRDNQNYLKNVQDNKDDYVANESSDYTTSSATFVDIDGTNFAISLTTNGSDVLVGFSGTVNVGNREVYFNIDVDGSPYFADDGGPTIGGNLTTELVGFVIPITGLSAGAHTFKLQWRVRSGGGTPTLYAGAGTTTFDVHPQFWVQEI